MSTRINNVPLWERENLSVKEAADLFHIGEHTIRNVIENPDCDCIVKVGRKIVIRREAFSQYLASKRTIRGVKK